ncbi:hypothetical protein V500_02834 [Pseudogymnoascus sp. VKM F-4518 (FW-2643)]|nr:hypothetical protein V500_02834 [Pseudogymnoascus sp. VKM F-4518 (FW-2643)]
MEAAGAVASIVGIAGFAGQAIVGLGKLCDFFRDCRNVSKTANRFFRDVTSLTEALKNVEAFLTKAQSLSNALHRTDLASLCINVEDCSKDVAEWVKKAEGMVSDATKSWFKKFVAAVEKQSVSDIFDQIGSHRSTIMLSLSATGRLLDAYNCSQSDVLVSKVGEATSYGKVTVEALSRLESLIEAPKSYEQDALNTSRSLSSIASTVSRIESLVSQQFRPSPPASANSLFFDTNNPYFRNMQTTRPSSSQLGSSQLSSPQDWKEPQSEVQAPPASGTEGPYSAALPSSSVSSNSGNSRTYNVPADVDQASQLEAKRRLRNAGASERFRQRRKWQKEEEDKKQQHIKDLERKLEEVDQERAFYRGERDRFRDAVLRNPNLALQNLLGPQSMRASSFPGPGQQLGGPPPSSQGMIHASLAEYMRLSLSTQDCRAHFLMLSALVDNLDSPNPELEDLCIKVKEQLVEEINRLRECRATNWNAGHDLEGLDRLMENQLYNKKPDEAAADFTFEQYSSPESQLKPWWDVLHHTISQCWVTKTDRINSWLLQNLATLPEEANRHRMFIPDGEQLGEEQWARLVLKFWPLDEAAPMFELGACSTNDAVDSAGACHSARVLLIEMPFDVGSKDQVMDDPLPLRRKWNVVSEGKGSNMMRTAKRKRVEEESEAP